MMGIIVCCAFAPVGVDFGWQPVAGGGVEYIIQIEPQMLERLRAGEDVFSDLPPRAGNIRGYRITVGTSVLPHHGQPPPAGAPAPRSPQADRPTNDPLAAEGPLPGPVLGPVLTMDQTTPGAAQHAAPAPLHRAEAAKPLENQPTGFERAESNATESHASSSSSHQRPATKRAAENRGRVKQSHEVRRPASSGRPPVTSAPPSPNADVPQAAGAKTPARKSGLPSAETASPARPSPALFGLFASLGVNAFLLWVAVSQRTRYRALVKVGRAA